MVMGEMWSARGVMLVGEDTVMQQKMMGFWEKVEFRCEQGLSAVGFCWWNADAVVSWSACMFAADSQLS